MQNEECRMKTPSYPPVRGRLYRDCALEFFPSDIFIEKNISELLLTSLPLTGG